MEQREEAMELLDLIDRPAFCVQNNLIVKINPDAQNLMIKTGTDVQELLLTGKEEYAAFREGHLYLTLQISGQSHNVSVQRRSGFDLFLFDREDDDPVLRGYELVSVILRKAMSGITAAANELSALEAPGIRSVSGKLNKSILQVLRLANNLSAAGRFRKPALRMETQDICAFLENIFIQAAGNASRRNIRITFRNHPSPILCLIDPERLERAVLNILANALEATPNGGTIDASLTRNGNMLSLQIVDSGPGISEEIRHSLYRQHLRSPSITDGNQGMGLGIVLIQGTAASHGGALLIDQPEGCGTRVTMTLATRQNKGNVVRATPISHDYAGGYNHVLMELSDSLPESLYE